MIRAFKRRIINRLGFKVKPEVVNLNAPLCYHSISDESWEGEVAHRISKENFAAQLQSLKRDGYTFLPIDEYLETKTKKKVTSVTFDDGYRDVCTHATEVLVDERIPFTLFVNGCLLEGKILWRDMIRILIQKDLVNDFGDFLRIEESELWKVIDWRNFYKSTKVNGVSSLNLTSSLETFLKKRSIDTVDHNKYVRRQDLEALPSDLFSLGNHTANHYRLSTLSRDQQLNEITEVHNLLEQISCPKSRVFSVPFGGNDSFNQDTIDILGELEYLGFLTTDTKPYTPKEYGVDIKSMMFSSRVLRKNEP